MTLLSPHGEPLQNPYEILGLERGATDDDVSKAFKKLMLKLHPDKQPAGISEEEAAKTTETFHNVMAAKSFLLDSEHMTAKRAYDSKLASLDRQKNKFNIPSFHKNAQSGVSRPKQEDWKSKRRGSDCTDDRRPNLFKKVDKNRRRASCDDCSTTSQSSSGDDVPPRNKSSTSPSRKEEKQKPDKKLRDSRQTSNTKSSRHQRNGSGISKTCKKASSFSESCSSFFTDSKESKKLDIKHDKKVQDRKNSMGHKRPSLSAKTEKPPSPNHVKPRMSISSPFTPCSSPEAHHEAKQRITNSIEAVAKKFKCPLTKEIMNDPWTDFERNSYEREAILKYLETHSTSPVTGAPLYACHLTANAALKERIRCTMGKYAIKRMDNLLLQCVLISNIICVTAIPHTELKKTLDNLGAAQKKELKHVTKQHIQHQTAAKPQVKSLRDSINSFITELKSGSPTISMSNLDDNGITNFSYLGIKFKLEVSDVNSFSVQTLFDHNKKAASISARLVEWNKALQEIGLGGKLTFRNANGTFTFSFNKNMEPEEFKSRTLRYSIEYFLEFAIKLHNIINVNDLKTVGKVRLSA
jgi:curved DNA-binding protein CbpA